MAIVHSMTFDEKLVNFRDKTFLGLSVKVVELKHLWLTISEGKATKIILEDFYRLVHTMKGGGEMIGLVQFSEKLEKLEIIIMQNLSSKELSALRNDTKLIEAYEEWLAIPISKEEVYTLEQLKKMY